MVQSGTQPLAIPPDVARAAMAQNFGSLLDQRQTRHRYKITLTLLVGSVVSFALLYGVLVLAPNLPGILLGMDRMLLATFCALTLVCLGQAVRFLVKPAKGYFIYERGFV